MKKEREIVDLTLALEDEVLTDAQGKRLAELLEGDEEAQLLYVRTRDLAMELESRMGNSDAPGVPMRRSWSTWLGIAAAAVLAFVVVAAIAVAHRPGSPDPEIAPYPHTVYVATITESVKARWSHQSGDVGPALPPGRLQVETGWLQLEFAGSAKLVVKGPAQIVLTDANRAELVVGGARAEVPAVAKGFTLGLPKGELVDLGTGFAARVAEDGTAQVQVIEGVVELRKTGDAPLRMVKGDGVRVDNKGCAKRATVDLRTLVGTSEVRKMAEDEDSKGYARWQALRDTLRRDEDLLFYYDFEPMTEDQRTLRQIAVRPEGNRADGAIVGARWSSGRWQGKGALDFKQINDRVRIDIPDEINQITLAAWIRMDGFDRPFNSLLLSYKWDPGDLHWQIKRSGALELAHKRNSGGVNQYTTKPVLTQANLGNWVHIVTTYDAARPVMIHYLNGKKIGELKMVKSAPIVIGLADIGNWSPYWAENPTFKLRNFNGRMDEMLAYRRVLSADEVRKLYEAGKP